MSSERKFSAVHVYAMAFWVAGGAAILLNILFFSVPLGQAGLFCAGIGGVLNIKVFIYHHHVEMLEAYRDSEERERNAFELGRDVGRDNVRSMH